MVGRKKLDRDSLHARVAPRTADKLKEIAYKLGYIYNNEGSTGQLLDAIAEGKITLVTTNDFLNLVDTFNKLGDNCKYEGKINATPS